MYQETKDALKTPHIFKLVVSRAMMDVFSAILQGKNVVTKSKTFSSHHDKTPGHVLPASFKLIVAFFFFGKNFADSGYPHLQARSFQDQSP